MTRHRVTALDALERERLATRLYPIFAATVGGVTLAAYRDRLLFSPDTHRLALMWGEDQRLAGYVTSQRRVCELEGEKIVLLGGAVHSDLAYRGAGKRALRFGATEALRARLRYPGHELCFAAATMSASAYRMFADHVRVYPSPDAASPAWARALLEPAAQMQGMTLVDPTHALARSLAVSGWTHERERQVRASGSLSHNRYARFFQRCVPPGHHMLVVVPLGLSNLGRALLPTPRPESHGEL